MLRPKAERGPRTYIFQVSLVIETDGRWSAVCPVLPGCATWARTRAAALDNIQEAVELYVEDLLESGEPLPHGIRALDTPAVTVSV
jgi:predicted RNase H-like HicB family nuclease